MVNPEEGNLSREATRHIRKNEGLLVDAFANIDKHPSQKKPASVFMAGAPGAGKGFHYQ